MRYTYLALFRGINIGGHHLLPMKELIKLLQGMGCENISTYIQSGNVVFQTTKKQSKTLAKAISRKICEHYGFEPKVLLLEAKELQKGIDDNPFPPSEGKALHLFFLDAPPEAPNLERLRTLKSETEDFKLAGNRFYLYTPDGVGRSKLAANVEKCLGVPATARNWNTVNRLLSMISQAQSASTS